MRSTARVVLVAMALAAAACATGTSFTSTWRAPDAQPGTFQGKPVVAVFVSDNEALRRSVEDELARQLTERGAMGIAAYTIIPTAEIRDEAKAKARLASSGAEGVVALRLVSRGQETSMGPATYYNAAPYTGVWGGAYWSTGWSSLYDAGGTIQTDTVLLVQTHVYSLEQNKLVWAGESRTTNPDNASALVKELVGRVAAEMKKAGLVQHGG